MKNMLAIHNAKHVCFFPIDEREQAEEMRRDPRLKWARIEEVFQAHPSRIEYGAVYEKNGPTWAEEEV